MSGSSSIFSSDARRLARKCALLAGGVLALCALLGTIETFGDVDVVGDKLRSLRENPSEFNTLFVGSSYVYREISPATFDLVTASRGVSTRSFNVGIPGMDPPETYFVIDRILQDTPGRIDYVVLELDYFREQVRPRLVHTRRFDYWHDAERTIDATRGLAESAMPVEKRVKDASRHAEAFARRFFALGRGRVLVGELFARPGADVPEALGSNGDGFRSLDEEEGKRFAARRGFFAAFEEDRYDEKLAILAAGGDPEGESEPVGQVDVEALTRTLRRIRERGARPILLVPPCLSARTALLRLRDSGVVADVLAFNSPSEYPTLYDPVYRYDVGHLNAEGATEFSRLLAERFADLVAKP